MKTSKIILGLFILFILTAFAISAQQHFVQTVSALNKNCNAVCSVFDNPALNNNPHAIIFITPIAVNYPHPIGAYYMYLNRWSVFNLDGTAMVAATTFEVEYYANPDSSHFVYVAPPLVQPNDVRFIDHAGLNNNQNAQVRVFPTNSPPAGVTGANLNSTEVRAAYDLTTSKWFIYNMSSVTVPSGTAYNIKFSGGEPPIITNPNAGKEINSNEKTPISNEPTINNPNSGKELNTKPPATPITNTTAGGDLNGNYPNPNVIGLQGRPLSSDQPKIGQVLRWGLAGWEPADESTATTPNGNAVNNSNELPKSYYGFLGSDYTWAPGSGNQVSLPGMSVQITLTKPSIVNVSAYVHTKVNTDCGVLACGPQATNLRLYRNNAAIMEAELLGSNGIRDHILPNYPDLLGPGTYTYQVNISRVRSESSILFYSSYNFKSFLSVQVFPQN